MVEELSGLADDIEQGMYENWQAGGIMQRLITSPLMRWADLLTVQRWAAANLPAEQAEHAEQQISRFFAPSNSIVSSPATFTMFSLRCRQNRTPTALCSYATICKQMTYSK